MKVTPLKDKVLIQKLKRKQEEHQSQGGLFLPMTTQAHDCLFTVLEIGPDVKDVAKGDVVYVHHDGRKRPVVGTDLYVTFESEILYKQN